MNKEQGFKNFIKTQDDLSYDTIESAYKTGWNDAIKSLRKPKTFEEEREDYRNWVNLRNPTIDNGH